MIKITLTFLTLSLLSSFQINSCSNNASSTNKNTANLKESKQPLESSNTTKVNKGDTKKFLTIRELNEKKPNEGIFETVGYVVKITDCPACPPNAQCKPCMAENLIISEENKSLNNYDLIDRELIIFTKDSESFKKGNKYKFKIKITNKKTTSAKLNDIELISSTPINN